MSDKPPPKRTPLWQGVLISAVLVPIGLAYKPLYNVYVEDWATIVITNLAVIALVVILMRLVEAHRIRQYRQERGRPPSRDDAS